MYFEVGRDGNRVILESFLFCRVFLFKFIGGIVVISFGFVGEGGVRVCFYFL